MRIKDLVKGQKVEINRLGLTEVVSVTKSYVRVRQLEFSGIIAKVHFACDMAPISDLGIIVKS